MIDYIEKSKKKAKNFQKYTKLIQVMSYLIIWSISIIMFWVSGTTDAMGYSLVVFYLVLPVSIFVISVFIGKDSGWSNYKWIMPLFFGFLYMLASFATFSLANTIAFGKLNVPDVMESLPGIICSVVGMIIGTIISVINTRKVK